ncbi:MAG: TonB-dependent receptor [Pseudomonadota bacterium]
MTGNTMKRRLLASSVIAGAMVGLCAIPATAQETDAETSASDDDLRQSTVIITGTRIQAPGIVSSSPITTVDQEEFALTGAVEVERLFRDLPIALPGDNQNVNNGTSGATTVDLRGLDANRTLVLVDGKRMVPFDVGGEVDVSAIPVTMLERIDVVTGGASAVYGSDAMAGAVNFILKDDFEGVEINSKYRFSEEGDGELWGDSEVYSISALIGSNLDDGRGNVALAVDYTDRKGVLLGDRDYSEFGVSTANGPNEGGAPASPDANCDAPNATLASTGVGSTTSIPTALDLPGGTIQFLNDGTTGPRCSRFNFSPFNYLQTPQERFVGMATGRYEINNNFEAYARANFSAINVRQQVAPSGVFGNQFEIPLMNPFLSDSARQDIIDNVNGSLDPANGFGLAEAGVNDLNGNGIFDLGDSITTPVRRRTLELGTRSTNYDSNNFQIVTGLRGDLYADWEYDVYYSHAQADRTDINAGYTNVSAFADALNTVSATQCETPAGDITSGCVPIDLFSTGFGSITPEMAAANSATAILKSEYRQNVFSAVAFGPVSGVSFPTAADPITLSVGTEYREEVGSTTPDECLKEPPTSCLGGAGGTQAPIISEFDVTEFFAEAFVPIVQDMEFAQDLQLEAGFRTADYSTFGNNETWKIGLNWEIVDGLRFRVMQQQAVRAPNVEELGSPVVTGLEDAAFDPCSNGNPIFLDGNGDPDPTLIANALAADTVLRDNCIATGVLEARIGLVNDIVSGQINTFEGTDPDNLPQPETADTFTIGMTWQAPTFGNMTNALVTLDYYDIEIEDEIGEFNPQEVLDNCYIRNFAEDCAKINRIGGTTSTSGAGVEVLTTNLDFRRAEGIDFNLSTDWDLAEYGELSLGVFATLQLTNESQATEFTGITDCLGKFGNDCQPTPELRFNQRSTWRKGPYTASLLWRYFGEVEVQESQRDATFDGFETIEAQHRFDLSGAWDINENVTLSANIRNIFDEDPPIVGNQAGSTARNFGNTFPSAYETLGRLWTVSVKAAF